MFLVASKKAVAGNQSIKESGKQQEGETDTGAGRRFALFVLI